MNFNLPYFAFRGHMELVTSEII